MAEKTMDRARARLLQIHTDWVEVMGRWQPQTEEERAIKKALDDIRQEYANLITPPVAIREWWRMRAVENGMSFGEAPAESLRRILRMYGYQELQVLPVEFQQIWRARLEKASPTKLGVFRLVGIRRTEPKSWEDGRIIVRVINEDEVPLAGVAVAFAYSTGPDQVLLSEDFLWVPPREPSNAHIVRTRGGGEIEEIQHDVVKAGQAGGVTVYALHPLYSSDVVVGAGMLSDHSGMHLTFQLQRAGVRSVREIVDDLERRLIALEKGRDSLVQNLHERGQ